MRALVPLAALLLALPLPGAAVNPLDDDAGSGGDAADHWALAAPLAPGIHGGRVSRPHDVGDWYALDLAPGQLLRWGLVGTPRPVGANLWHASEGTPPSGGTFPGRLYGSVVISGVDEFLVPFAGRWYVDVAFLGPTLQGALARADYRLQVEVGKPAFGAAWHGRSWSVAEARWDEPRDVLLYRHASSAVGLDAGHASFVMAEWDLVRPDGFRDRRWSGFGYATYATGTGVAVAALGARVGPMDLGVEYPSASGAADELFKGVTGWVRLQGFATTADKPLLALVASGPVDVRHTSGDDLVRWGTHDGKGVVAPGLALGERSATNVDVSEGSVFLGAFWAESGGAITSPDGTRVEVTGPEALAPGLGPGRWGFEVEPRVGVGPQASVPYLAGAHLPRLGLAP